MSEPPDPPDSPPEVEIESVPAPRFEGAEVPREPSGRVSREYRSDPAVEGETIGTPEQISALTIKLAELKAGGGLRGERGKLYRRLNLERARLLRRRDRMTRDRIKLRLIRAQASEKVARRTIEEAAKALDGTADVLKNAITDFGRIATEKLAPSLVSDLNSPNEEHRREAQRMLRDITIAIIDLHKTAQKKVDIAEKRGPVATSWPDEGMKT